MKGLADFPPPEFIGADSSAGGAPAPAPTGIGTSLIIILLFSGSS